MKKLWLGAFGILLMGLAASAASLGQEKSSKPGPLTGSWECSSHGGQRGDSKFTLGLQQDGEKVSGGVDSSEGGMEITSGTFKDDTLELHLDTGQGSYVLTAKLKDGELTGSVTLDGKPESTWEGKKAAPPPSKSAP